MKILAHREHLSDDIANHMTLLSVARLIDLIGILCITQEYST